MVCVELQGILCRNRINICWAYGHLLMFLKIATLTTSLKDKIRSSGNNIPSIGDSGFTLWIMHPKRLCLRMIPSFPGGAMTSRLVLKLNSGRHIILGGSCREGTALNRDSKSWLFFVLRIVCWYLHGLLLGKSWLFKVRSTGSHLLITVNLISLLIFSAINCASLRALNSKTSCKERW